MALSGLHSEILITSDPRVVVGGLFVSAICWGVIG